MNRVFLYHDTTLAYPECSPYDPSECYPEYPLGKLEVGTPPNPVYRAVRNLFALAGLDSRHHGAPDWNPLGHLIKPKMRVLIKPNMVRHFHPRGLSLSSVMTHGSVVRAVCDYVVIALSGEGTITIGDAPVQSADFSAAASWMGLPVLAQIYAAARPNLTIRLADFRTTRARALERGQQDSLMIDLGTKSALEGLDPRTFKCEDYPAPIMRSHHSPGEHKYAVASDVLSSDVIISIPKPKTHRYAGISAGLKAFIGVNVMKGNLPHFRSGAVTEGGDEAERTGRTARLRDLAQEGAARLLDRNSQLGWKVGRTIAGVLARLGNDTSPRGQWHKNDTIWRTIHDVYRVVRNTTSEGSVLDHQVRPIVTIADLIEGGEGDGPLNPDPVRSGVLALCENPYLLDTTIANMFGFNPEELPLLAQFPEDLGPTNCQSASVISNDPAWNGCSPSELFGTKNYARPTSWQQANRT